MSIHITRKMLLAGLVLLVSLPIIYSFAGTNAQAQSGTAGSLDHFIGLWQGIDTDDGAIRTISISDLDGDGVFEIIQHDTYWSLCAGDRGFAEGAGTAEADGTLRTESTVICFLPDDETIDAPLVNTYEYVPGSDIVLESPIDTIFLPNILHRISSNVPAASND